VTADDPVGERPQRHRVEPVFWIGACAVLALVLKLVIALGTVGTNDVIRFYEFAADLTHVGLEQTYRLDPSFNHPPLVSHFLTVIYDLSHRPFAQAWGISFPFLLRLPGIVADLAVVLLLLRLRTRKPELHLPLWSLFLLALSPVSIMVSGFHGNTDSVLVLFLILALLAGINQRPGWCGFALALSCQIKIVPLLFLPAFLFYWITQRRSRAFAGAFGLTIITLWSEALLRFPLVFFRNVFGYGGFWGTWGITYWLSQTGAGDFSRSDFQHLSFAQNLTATLLKLVIVSAAVLLAYRRRNRTGAQGLCDSLAITWLIFFVFSPGIGAQYLVWIAPFLLLWSPQIYLWLTAASSLFLFVFYNVISGGLPWYYGVSNGSRNAEWLPWTIWPWMILASAIVLLSRNRIRKAPALPAGSAAPLG
jgi:hypothetical protein